MHTLPSGNNGNTNSVTIGSGTGFNFALTDDQNQSLRATLTLDSYRTGVAAHAWVWACANDWIADSTLEFLLIDASNREGTSGTTLAKGEMTVDTNCPSIDEPGANDNDNFDLTWESGIPDSDGKYEIEQGRYLVVRAQNTGGTAIKIGIDSGTDGDTPTSLEVVTNPVSEISLDLSLIHI